ncbi:MAG: SpoIIE family protein phosphatase, partial [Acidobacteria bacterium]|nr:SpoIIE family protein phosphatase [Acidobacteriota bacterium]
SGVLTLAQVLADRGQIRLDAVARHRFRHILTSVLGGHPGPVDTEIQHLRLADKDRLLLCTDGLTDMLEDATIAEALKRCEDSAETCKTLIDLALEAGGKDNVTVVLARYEFPPDSSKPETGAG